MRREDRVIQARETRSTILRAAAQQISVRGYSATSLADIAAVFDKPKTALRYHFASKADIALAISDYQNAVWESMIEAERARGESGVPGLLHLLEAAIADARANPYAGAVIQMRRLTRDPDWEGLGAMPFSWFDVALEYIVEACAAGELPAASDPTVVARFLIDSTFGAHQLAATGRDRDFSTLWRHLLIGLGATDPDSLIARAYSTTSNSPAR